MSRSTTSVFGSTSREQGDRDGEVQRRRDPGEAPNPRSPSDQRRENEDQLAEYIETHEKAAREDRDQRAASRTKTNPKRTRSQTTAPVLMILSGSRGDGRSTSRTTTLRADPLDNRLAGGELTRCCLPVHRGCDMAITIGHLFGICSWTGWDDIYERGLELIRRDNEGLLKPIESETTA
jgi:hypothetical protein